MLVLIYCTTYSQYTRATIKALVRNNVKADTNVVYSLPYGKHVSKLMVQGYYTSYSHKGEIANDFAMRKGSKVCAARAGVVIATKQDGKLRGLANKYMNEWNYVYILHSDGSTAIYGHLMYGGVLVLEGDSVRQGQAIGLSGNTGYSAFAHLHFQVWDAAGKQLPVRFYTTNGIRYLRGMRRYRAV